MALNVERLDYVKSELDELAEILGNTLGPYGRTTIIEEHSRNHTITKDGYTVIRNLHETDDRRRIILDLIKKTSFHLVKTVGDGSTSAVLAARNMHDGLSEFLEANPKIPPQDVIETMTAISQEIIKEMRKFSRKADSYDVRNVAYIATNGEDWFADLVQSVYDRIGPDGVIRIIRGVGEDTSWTLKKGTELNRGMVGPEFATSRDLRGNYCDLEDPFIFMCDGTFGDDQEMHDFHILWLKLVEREKEKVPVVVIAERFSPLFLEFGRTNKNKKDGFPICLVDFSTAGTDQQQRFLDLAAYVDAVPVLKKLKAADACDPDGEESALRLEMFGRAKSFRATDNKTRIIGGGGFDSDGNPVKGLAERIKGLKDEIAKNEQDANIAVYSLEESKYKSRLAVLEGTVAEIKVGGMSDQDRELRVGMLEDAVHSCRSALKHGVVVGGNTSIPKAINRMTKNRKKMAEISVITPKCDRFLAESILVLISKSFRNVYRKVVEPFFQDPDFCSVNVMQSMQYSDMIYNARTRRIEYFNLPGDRNVSKEKLEKATTVMNSLQTDVEILKGSIAILGLVAASNQAVRIPRPDG